MSQFNQPDNQTSHTNSNSWVYYQGGFLSLAMLLGGGTEKGLYTDYILQIVALPMVVHLFMRFRFTRANMPISVFFVGLFAVFAFQLLPLNLSVLEKSAFITVDVGRTLDSALYTLTLVAIFYGIYSLNETGRARVAPFLFLGVVANFVFAVTQFSANKLVFAVPGLPYGVGGGFFANYNHLASLLYVSIPFIVLAFHNRRYSIMSLPIIALILLFLLVVGSLAGVSLGVAGAIASYVFFSNSRILKQGMIFVLIVGTVGFAPFILDELAVEGRFALSRALFAQNTLEAIWNYLPFGSGFGTFVLVYPAYAVDTGLFSKFVNHAHNDYLELLLEGGVMSVILFLLYLAALFHILAKGSLSGLQTAALLGITFLLFHSTVDYPLRTLAMGTVFAFFNGLFFAGHQPVRRHRV